MNDKLSTFNSLNNIFYKPVGEKKPIFNLLYCNIRSVRKNFDNFLLEFSLIKETVHFIVMSEVWIKEDEINLYNLPNYTTFARCNSNYRSGGVICYVLNSVSVSQLNVNCMACADTLLLDVRLNNSRFKLCCIYRLQEFLEVDFVSQLDNYFQYLTNDTIFVGDFNLNILNKQSITISNYLNLMYNNGFTSLVNEPTRITQNSSSCIDHIFIRHRKINCFTPAIFDINLTDHCMLGLKFEVDKVNHDVSANIKPLLKQYIDFDQVQVDLSAVDWNEIINGNNVDICFNLFHSKLTSILNNNKKCLQLNKKFLKAKLKSPWITHSLLRKIRKRGQLYNKLKRRPYDVQFKNYYNNYCLGLNAEIVTIKNQYYSNKLRDCEGDPSGQWRIVNSLTGMQGNTSVDKIELEDGTVECDPQTVADKLNNHIVNVALSDVSQNGVPSVEELGLRHLPHSFFVSPVEESELLYIIKNLKNKKSTGYDGFSVNFIKTIAESISPVFAHICNLSFSQGVFPKMLKSSVVVPILKKDKSIKFDNIRPISLLSIFSKIIEKLMQKRLIKYLDKIKLISCNQFGFQKGKSTEDALVVFTSRIYNGFNSNERVSALFVDFKKAFDLVNHNILLSKLEAVGVRGVALDWFRSFLVGREQRVRVRDCLSAPLAVTVGVPQGSVTAATLFLIFINDLLLKRFRGIIQAFADDIVFSYSNKDLRLLQHHINCDLVVLRDWCIRNRMQVNVKKTKYINFAFNGFDFESPLYFHDANCTQLNCLCEKIEKVGTFKFLGVILDEKCSWEKHISFVHGKIRQSIRTFYFLRNYCDEALLKSLYFALIHSRLQYGIVCWGGTFRTLINRLRVTQNFYMRVILKKTKRESSFPLFRRLKVLPIQNLFIFKVLKLFYIVSGNTGTENLFYNTRSYAKNLFRTPKVNKNIFKQSYQFLGPHIFNKLPLYLKSSNNLKSFLFNVKCWLFLVEDVSFLHSILS